MEPHDDADRFTEPRLQTPPPIADTTPDESIQIFIVLDIERHRQHWNALFEQVDRLFARRGAVDLTLRRFLVMNATRLLGKPAADVIRLLEHLLQMSIERGLRGDETPTIRGFARLR